jgi:outer membrane beta-barrel protein
MKRCQAAVVAAVLFLGCLQPFVAQGANLPYSLSVTPFAGGYVFEGNQHRRNGEVYGIAFGFNLSENWALELTGTYNPDVPSTTIPQQQTVNLYEVRGDVLYHFIPEQRFVPYVAAGGGLMIFDPRKAELDEDALADVGGGFKLFLTDFLALRGDIRYIIDFTTHDINRTRHRYNNFIYTTGLTFQLGGVKPTVRPAEEAKPAPVETVQPAAVVEKPAPIPVEPAPASPVTAPVTEAPVAAPVEEGPVTVLAEKQGTVPEGKIMLTGLTIDQNALEITTTAQVKSYKTFTLSQPSRLVIDINDAINGLGASRVPVHKFGILAVRLGTHPNFLRIVLDPEQGKLLPYRVVETAAGLKVIMATP